MGTMKLVDKIGQFTTIPNTVVTLCPKIGADAMTLFVYLRYRTNHDTGEAFPSLDTICSETGLTRRRAVNAANVLVKNDLLEKRRRFSGSTVYTLKMPSISTPSARLETPIGAPAVPSSSAPAVPSVVPQVPTNQTDPNQTDPNQIKTLREKIESHLHTLYNGTYTKINPVIRIDDVLGKIAIGVETDAPQLAAQVRTYLKGTPQRKYKVSVAVVPSVTSGDSLAPLERLKADLADEYYQCRGGAVFIDDNIERSALAHLAQNNWTRAMLRAKYTELNTQWRKDHNVPVTLAAIAKHLPGATHAATLATPAPIYTDAQRTAADAINAANRARRAQAGL